jgi:hypothetical protein
VTRQEISSPRSAFPAAEPHHAVLTCAQRQDPENCPPMFPDFPPHFLTLLLKFRPPKKRRISLIIMKIQQSCAMAGKSSENRLDFNSPVDILYFASCIL